MARILTITNWYPPHHVGGYEVLCDEVMTRLQARGHQVEILCSDERREGVEGGEAAPYPVHRQLKMYWRDGRPWTPTGREQLDIERSNQQVMAAALERFRPDVVSVWHMGALSLSLLTTVSRRQIPMVYAICDEWLMYGLALDPWSNRWYRSPPRRFAGRLAERVLGVPTVVADLGPTGCFCFLSEFTKESSMAASPWSYPVAPVIHPGIDRTRFPTSGSATDGGWSWKLLYTGRLDPRKGTDTLLQALALLPTEATLALLGRGEDSERVRLADLAVELGISDRVRFESIPRSELAGAYLDHDCLIFPSEWPEPFGMVPLEAMACGTPVVATGTGGSGEYLSDGENCLLFPPGDAHALAAAVLRLAEDATLRTELRRHGWVTADRFDVDKTAERFEVCHVAAAEGRLGDGAGISVDPPLSTPRFGPEVLELPRLSDLGGPVLAAGARLTDPRSGQVFSIVARTSLLTEQPGSQHEGRDSVSHVVADAAALPFRDGAFGGVLCRDTLRGDATDRPFVNEIARVLDKLGVAIFQADNRQSAASSRRRARQAWQGWRHSPGLENAPDVTWRGMESSVAPTLRIAERPPMGRRRSFGPLRRFSHTIVMVAART